MAEDSGGLGGLLGWFGRGYDPQAAYEGLLSSQPTQDALRARSLASIAQAFGAGAGSDARGSAIPFGTTMGNAAAAAYGGQDALIAARNVAAEQQLHQAQAGVQRGILSLQPIELEMYRRFAAQQEKEAGAQKAGLSPKDIIAGGGGARADGGGGETYWTPQGLAALRPTEGAYDQIHYPSGDPSTASGAYGFLDKTWQQQAPKAGVDIEKYPRAYLAPPAVQDAVAAITPISHWTGTDAKGNPYNFRAQRLATNPAYVTGGGGREPTAADAPVTPVEAEIYRKAPFPTVQNAGVVPPPVMTDKLPTGTIAPNPFNTPTGGPAVPPAAAPAALPASGAGGVGVTSTGGSPAGIGGAVGGEKLSGLLGTQDPVTAQTMAALRGTAGAAPGVNAAAPSPVASLLNTPPSVPAAPPGADIRQALGAAGAPPQVPPELRSLLAQAGGGAPPIPQGGVPQGPPPVVQGGVGTDKGGGLLNAPPPAPPVIPPAAVPPAAAPGMPPGGVPLPALPPMPTLPAPPQMRDVPVPPMPAPTTLEGMAQAISGISSLTGHPAPAFMQDLAKMPAARQQELYKAYLLNETNAMNEKYKAQIQLTTSEYVKAAEARGALPAQITQELLKQQLWLNPQTNRYEMLPGAVEKLALEEKTKQDAQAAREKEVAAAAPQKLGPTDVLVLPPTSPSAQAYKDAQMRKEALPPGVTIRPDGSVSVQSLAPTSEQITANTADMMKLKDEALEARKGIYGTQQLRQQLHAMGMSGPATGVYSELGAWAQSLGVLSEDQVKKYIGINPASEQIAEKLSQDLLGEVLKTTFPGRITNADVVLWKNTVPRGTQLQAAYDTLIDKVLLPKFEQTVGRYGAVAGLPGDDPQLRTYTRTLEAYDKAHPLDSFVQQYRYEPNGSRWRLEKEAPGGPTWVKDAENPRHP